MIKYKEFLSIVNQGGELPTQFQDDYGCYVYRMDYHSRNALNATLETEFTAVYREVSRIKNQKWKGGDLDLCCDEFFIVTKKGKVLHHTNSEWGSIGYAK